jgi:hypothetical protein
MGKDDNNLGLTGSPNKTTLPAPAYTGLTGLPS